MGSRWHRAPEGCALTAVIAVLGCREVSPALDLSDPLERVDVGRECHEYKTHLLYRVLILQDDGAVVGDSSYNTICYFLFIPLSPYQR